MGSLSRNRAKSRVRMAMRQAEDELEAVDKSEARATIQKKTIEKLLDVAMDSQELNRVAREVAVNPDVLDIPGGEEDG